MKKIFYHIHKIGIKDELWKIGNEIDIGEDNNEFFKTSLNYESKIRLDDIEYPFQNVYKYFVDINNIQRQLELLNYANNFISEYQILIRELGMEDVRKNLFSKLPSRQKCIWLCRKDQIDYWRSKMMGKTEVFEIEVFNTPFKSRNFLIPLPSDSYNKILEKSKQYWQGVDNVENEDDEYLYIGKLKIINKF